MELEFQNSSGKLRGTFEPHTVLTREPSARVAEVDSDSEDEFQDSREALPPRSLAESITATRVPQVTTHQTMQPPSLNRHRIEKPESGESPQYQRLPIQRKVLVQVMWQTC